MVGHAASPTCTVHVDVTVTPSKVKVKVTEHLNFRQLSKPCMLAAMTQPPCGAFWLAYWFTLMLSRSSSKVKVIGSRSQDENVLFSCDAFYEVSKVPICIALCREQLTSKVLKYGTC